MKTKIFILSLLLALVAQLAAKPEPTRVIEGKVYVIYKIKKGDTYYSIAKKYKKTVTEIQNANGNKTLLVNQELLIPTNKTATSTRPPASSGLATNLKKKQHTVSKGETLSSIAKQYGISVEELKKANKLSSDNISVGKTLIIPSKPIDATTTPNTNSNENTQTGTSGNSANSNTNASQNNSNGQTGSSNSNQNQNSGAQGTSSNGSGTNTAATNNETGMPAQPKPTSLERFEEKRESGSAKVAISDKLEKGRVHLLHPNLPVGTMVVLVNPESGKMAYCKVAGNFNPEDFNDASVLITQATADKMGLKSDIGEVSIRYAVPKK